MEARSLPEKGGYGVFTRQVVQPGELLVVWGGQVMSGQQLHQLSPAQRMYALQVEEDLYLVSSLPAEPADFINHSCAPNAGLSGQIALVALRLIYPNEEICFDYAMSDGSPYDEFECQCHTPLCRGYVSGNDWTHPELWERYGHHFSPYLLRRIEKLRQGLYRNGRNAPELTVDRTR
ncbi:MAG: SET domain-containing protein-lysine N-methyltransferase [Chloroflexota bacterium]